MSIPNDITVRCPGCGEEFPARIFQSINSDYAPDVAEQIISGSMFRAPCPIAVSPAPDAKACDEYKVLYRRGEDSGHRKGHAAEFFHNR